MLTIPIPFVTAMVLLILTIVLFLLRHALSVKTAVLRFVLVCALLNGLIGLRWSTSWHFPLILMPIITSSLGSLAWWCFHPSWRIIWHVMPIAFVGVLAITFPIWHIDPYWLVALITLTYGVLLINKGMQSEGFSWAKFTEVRQASHLAVILGAWLCWKSVIDVMITWDFMNYHGQHAAHIVSIAHSIMLLVICHFVIKMVSLQMPAYRVTIKDEPKSTKDTSSTSSDTNREIIAHLSYWLIEENAYQDDNLNLDKMARKLGLPVRSVSNAINQETGQGVSQWVNHIRIEQAKIKLISTSDSVITIMQDCGYLTKSNFNKTFKRTTGMTPTQWRNQQHS